MTKKILFYFFILFTLNVQAQSPDYLNPKMPVEIRVQDLLKRLTLEEKVGQIQHESPAITRLKVPAYNWWNEALHGVANAGLATSFPQPIGLAATFDKNAIFTMGTIISDEARAKHHQAEREGRHEMFQGINFYSPNINIFRDPRWGRGSETYGEDPYLTGCMGVAFVKSMQGNNPNYFKTVCTAKHFAVHSGPETQRHTINTLPSKQDLWETYLPAFKMLVQDAHVYSIMCAYSKLYGEPCCANPFLLSDILRKQWGFKGLVVTDCGAAYDMPGTQQWAKDSTEAMAKSIIAGVDNFCIGIMRAVKPAIENGSLKMAQLDTAVARVLRTRIKLGMLDADALNPYAAILLSVVNNAAHKNHALEVAKESIVLLRNNNNILPLSLGIKSIAVLGPNANKSDVPLGNYNGFPAHVTTALEGIKNAIGGTAKVMFNKGCTIIDTISYDRTVDFNSALVTAAAADVIVFVGGISPQLEREQQFETETAIKVDGFEGGDRTHLDLPSVQTALLKELKKLNKPIILVLMNGSALSINWENENIDGIIESWYGGEGVGNAIADVLFGKYNPSGKLPVTFYKSVKDIPAFDDYAMAGKTYRYCNKPVLYPFGFGLSYTKFAYSDLKLSATTFTDKIKLTINVKNIGAMDGAEVVQLYLHQQGNAAIKELKGFERLFIKKGETKAVSFSLTQKELLHYSKATDGLAVLPGKVNVMVGASSDDIRLQSSFEIKY